MRIALLATALLLAPPLARACDTDYLNSQLTLVCRAALDPALALLRDLAPQATAAEAAAIARAAALAEAACETGDPEAGRAGGDPPHAPCRPHRGPASRTPGDLARAPGRPLRTCP